MKDKIVFIGDSLTFGYGVKKSDNWVNKIGEISSDEIINKGVNGSTTINMLDRFYQDVLIYKPAKVFIMGGTNDFLSNRTINSIVLNIELMIKDCISNNIKAFVGIPPTIIPKDAEKFFMPSACYPYCAINLPILRSELINLCNFYNCSFIDFYTLTLENIQNNIFSDGIHLNPKGQDLLFEYAKEFFIICS